MTDTHPVLIEPHRTLADALRRQARERGDQLACRELDSRGGEAGSVTYAELDRRVRSVAALLQQTVAPGERALVMYPNGLDFVVAFFACAYAGVVAVPAPCPEGVTGGRSAQSRLQGIVKDADPAAVMTTPELAALPPEDLGGGLRVVVGEVSPALGDLWQPPESAAVDPAFLQYTSGSTSTPKGVVISHAGALANAAAIAVAIRADSCPRGEYSIVIWPPLFHDLGLGHLLASVYIGGQLTLMQPVAFLLRPATWLEAVTRYRAVLSSAPNFAYQLCVAKVTDEQRAGLDLSGWRCALNGAEPIRYETLERFAAAFRETGFAETSFLPCYGLAEATVYVSGARSPGDARYVEVDTHALEQRRQLAEPVEGQPSRRIVACGRLPANLDARIVDPDSGADLGAGQPGEIWLAGQSIAESYWQQPEASAERFGGRLPGAAGVSFLRTGDLGFLREGQLFVLGRIDDLIILDGRNHYPQDLELTVGGCHPALAAAGCGAFAYQAGGETRVGIVAETARRVRVVPDDQQPRPGTDYHASEVVTAVRRAVTEEHQLPLEAVLLLRPGGLPRTTSGKVQRRRCRDLYLAGQHRTW